MKILRPEASASIKGHGGLDTAIDDVIIQAYNITDDEYDEICSEASDEEIGDFVEAVLSNRKPSFSAMRKGLEVRNKYVEYYRNIFTK